MASHLLKYVVLGTSLQPPLSELEVNEAVTSSYPPWVQELFVTSNLKTIHDALSVLNKLEPIEAQHYNPYPTAFPYGNGMVLHFYQQQESSTTKTVHKVINRGLKAYV